MHVYIFENRVFGQSILINYTIAHYRIWALSLAVHRMYN